MILDTSFLIDLLRGNSKAVAKAREIEQKSIVKTTSITAFELVRGARNKRDEKHITELLDGLIVLDFGKKAGLTAGNIARDLNKKGTPIDPEDVMIAAVALLDNEPVLTRNVRHFSQVKRLSVMTY
jgi:tRNA(fMet)-specific endonuclease VapC